MTQNEERYLHFSLFRRLNNSFLNYVSVILFLITFQCTSVATMAMTIPLILMSIQTADFILKIKHRQHNDMLPAVYSRKRVTRFTGINSLQYVQ